MTKLTLATLKKSAGEFSKSLSGRGVAKLFGVTDGKAVGTYVEHRFHEFLGKRYTYEAGSSASGIDFPTLHVDLKVTSIRQPQSSCPFRSAEQKVYGLGYHLIVFIYSKSDDRESKKGRLDFRHALFVSKDRTADYQTTHGIRGILERKGNKDDIVAFLEERNLPLEEVGRNALADRILKEPPVLGYLTVSNALQWRLQYGRIVTLSASGESDGLENLLT